MYVLNKEAISLFFKTKEMRVGREVYDRINEKVVLLLTEADARAKKNKRTTILYQDI